MSGKVALLEALEDLGQEEFEMFRWYLTADRPRNARIPRARLERANRMDTVDLLVQTHGDTAVEVTAEIFIWMRRNDLRATLTKVTRSTVEASVKEVLHHYTSITATHGGGVVAPNISNSRIHTVNISCNISATNQAANLDDVDYFLLNVAQDLKTLDARSRSEAKMKIQKIIHEAAYGSETL